MIRASELPDAQALAERTTIMRSLVGSGVHGTNVGTSDRDEMGVCCEPADYVVGLSVVGTKPFEQAVIRSKPEGVKSAAGDVDCTIYSLRKWARMVLGGNPSAMILLFVPQWAIVTQTKYTSELQDMASHFASVEAGRSFLGYIREQRMKLTGERGQMRVTRQDLIDKYGYDTKYAGHMIRLGFQGMEYLDTGRFTLPMREPERQRVLAVRRGEVSLADVLAECLDFEDRLQAAMNTSPLPASPDWQRVSEWVVDTYNRAWYYTAGNA